MEATLWGLGFRVAAKELKFSYHNNYGCYKGIMGNKIETTMFVRTFSP